MFKRIQNKTSRDLNVVKIDNINLENLGLYLDKDVEITYSQTKEIEEIYVPGRDMPYHKIIRLLPVAFEIEFNLKESRDFYTRIDYIKNFLEGSKEKVITFNNEAKGFKIYYTSIEDIKRRVGASTINISFQCYPNIVSLEN